jgi:hypothetical protein
LLVAIAHVWARGSIFSDVRTAGNGTAYWRFWRALADCPLCSGFWIGVLGHALYQAAPGVVEWLGVGSLVGTLALATVGAIRRL